jgi:hypothetical protein
MVEEERMRIMALLTTLHIKREEFYKEEKILSDLYSSSDGTGDMDAETVFKVYEQMEVVKNTYANYLNAQNDLQKFRSKHQ